MFQGASSLNLDGKGRLSVPTRHRDALLSLAEGQVTFTKHPDGCLLLFPRPEWLQFRERVAQLPITAQWWKRIFLGNAMDAEMDATGRLLISPELREATGLTKEVLMLAWGRISRSGTRPLMKCAKRKRASNRCRRLSRILFCRKCL